MSEDYSDKEYHFSNIKHKIAKNYKSKAKKDLFDRNRFGQIPWLVNIRAFEHRDMIGQHLYGDGV